MVTVQSSAKFPTLRLQDLQGSSFKFENFVYDVQLVGFDNARLYNPEEYIYYKNANQTELDFKAMLNANKRQITPNLLTL